MWRRIKRKKKRQTANETTPHSDQETLSPSVEENLNWFRHAFGPSFDLVTRIIYPQNGERFKLGLLYLDGLVDSNIVNESVIHPLTNKAPESTNDPDAWLTLIQESILEVGHVQKTGDAKQLLSHLHDGGTLILLEGATEALVAVTSGGKQRSISEPQTEVVIRGPQEQFTENLKTNMALIRRRIRNPNLWSEQLHIGRVTKTHIAYVYIKGVANETVIEEVRKRLQRIDIDSILESSYVEELIQDETYSPFPTVFNTERPDVVAADLLEGKVAILIDGTPFVLTVPALFIQFYQAAEDYYQRSDIASIIRILRFIALLITLLAPSIYIAITTFHHQMLPPTLIISLAAQREGVPFPAFIEALMLEIALEILREAGTRMPRASGSAVSIVGTLVIGLAGVEAGLFSAAMVIVVSITAISSFVTPAFNMAISARVLRFPLMALAASFGLIGISMGIIAIILHLCSLRSFSVPYLSPIAPYNTSDQKDTLVRFPRWGLITRPKPLNHPNPKRIEPHRRKTKREELP